MATLTFKAGASWFAPNVTTVKRNIITAIDIVDSYVITGNEIDSWDASEDNDGSIMCYVTGTTLTIAGNGSGTIKFNADQSYWLYSTDGKDYFKNCTSFTGLSLIDTSNCTTLNRSFRGLEKITSLDISHFDISNVTSLYQTFCYCKKLTSLPIENWDVSNVTTMAYTFYQTGASTLPIENWNVSNVTNLDHTFAHSTSLNNIDLTKWDVSNVTNMNATFCGMKALTSLDLSTWNTSKVTCFPQFVEGCSNLEVIYGLENFDTSKSVCFAQMFRGCSKLKELDLSSFDTRNADSGTPTSDNGSTSGCTWQMITNTHKLEKITLGKYFTFEGKGADIVPAEDIGTLPTPSATYIEEADGNWYTEDFTAYAPADVPNLTEMTYYASKKIVNDVIDTRVLNYKGLKYVLQSLNTVIDSIDLSGLETKEDAQAKLDAAQSYADTVKNDLLNGAGDAYDTLKELGDLIDDNQDALEALEILASVSEVEVSDTAPTDENVEIWINTSEEWNDNIAGGGVTSWNDLTDKPFYKEVTVINEPLSLTFNRDWEDETDRDKWIAAGYSNEYVNYIKVSDTVLSNDGVKTLSVARQFYGEDITIVFDWSFFKNGRYTFEDDYAFIDGDGFAIAIVREPNTNVKILPYENHYVTFPESGFYLSTTNCWCPFIKTTEQCFETIHPIDPIYLPDFSWDNLKNKPFGKENTILFEKANAVFKNRNGVFISMEELISPFGKFVIGQKYSVIWNGAEYNDLVAFYNEQGDPSIGSPLENITNDLPFSICTYEYNGNIYIYLSTISESDLHNISIIGEVTKLIEPEYLPAPSWNNITDRPFGSETVFTSVPFEIVLDDGWYNNISEDDTVTMKGGNRTFYYRRVSDVILSNDDIKNLEIIFMKKDEGLQRTLDWSHFESAGSVLESNYAVISDDTHDFTIVITREEQIYAREAVYNEAELFYPKSGIYVRIEPNTEDYFPSIKTKKPLQVANEVVHKIPYKYMPDGYPYKETKDILLLEKHQNAFFEDDGYGLQVYDTSIGEMPTIGEEYAIILDGVRYECTATDISSFDDVYGRIAMGNISIIIDGFEDTGEPFCVQFQDSWQARMKIAIKSSETNVDYHDFECYKFTRSIRPIAREFLPEGYPYKEVTGGINIEWDGNTEGLQSVGLVGGSTAYKVSDNLPTSEQCKKSTAVMLNVSDGSTQSMNMTDEMWSSYESAGLICEHYYVLFEGLVAVILKDNLTIDSMGGVTFEKAGVYFANVGTAYVQSFTSPTTETIHTMAPEFLPAGVGGNNREFIIDVGDGFSSATTYADVLAAIKAGKCPIAYWNAGGSLLKSYGYMVSEADGAVGFVFFHAGSQIGIAVTESGWGAQ